MSNPNLLFDNSQKSFKQRRLLKIKLNKISNKCIQPYCDKYITTMRDLRLDRLNNTNLINNVIKQSLNFHFGNNNSSTLFNNNINQINNTIKNDLSETDLNYKKFCKTLKKELSSNELEAIKSDQIYYLPDEKIRNIIYLNLLFVYNLNTLYFL